MSSLDEERPAQRADELVQWLRSNRTSSCAHCGSTLCAHDLLFASALGHRLEPICGTCAARELGHSDAVALRTHLRAHFERRACYRAAWQWASEREPGCPACEIRATDALPAPVRGSMELPHDTWDAGDLGCGELVLELRLRMLALEAGETLELFARDPGAPEDLPAWCRSTGHELLDARAPRYLIRRRADPARPGSV